MDEATQVPEYNQLQEERNLKFKRWVARSVVYLGWLALFVGGVLAIRWSPWVLLWLVVMLMASTMLERVAKFMAGMTLREQVAKMRAEVDSRNLQVTNETRLKALEPPPEVPGYIIIGKHIDGDPLPPTNDVKLVDGWLCLRWDLVFQHQIVIGKSGAGKSTYIKHLVSQVLTRPDMDVFVLEGKGDGKFSRQIVDMIANKRGEAIPYFSLGYHAPCTPYNLFSGDFVAIYNRLLALVDAKLMAGDAKAKYHVGHYRDALLLICKAECGPPKSLEEVNRRLTPKWMLKTWENHPVELNKIDELDPASMVGLRSCFFNMDGIFGNVVGNGGFTFEEVRGAVFSVKMSTVTDDGPRLIFGTIEDLKDFLGNRQQRPAVLIVDEFGAMEVKNISLLFSQGRSFEVGVIVAALSVHNFGDTLDQRIPVVEAPSTYFQMWHNNPEELLAMAGRAKTTETSQSIRGDGQTTVGIRNPKEYIVDPDKVRRLEAGQGYFIYRNRQWLVQIPQVPDPESKPENVATRVRIPYEPDEKNLGDPIGIRKNKGKKT